MRKAMRNLMTALIVALGLALVTAQPVAAATWGGKWAKSVVTIYDATGGGYQVEQLPAEWSVPGITLAPAADEASADIVVRAEYTCSGMTCYAGYFNTAMDGTTITHCDVKVDPGSRGMTVGAYSAAHEVGHCLGLAHNERDQKQSVMNVSVDRYTTVDKPSSRDRSNLRNLYS